MVTPIKDPREVSDDVFPDAASPREQLKFLLNYAVLAPSSHNSQPWRFKLEQSSVAIYADRTRALPVVDPDDREMIISCGAALFNLRAAIRGFGFEEDYHAFPSINDPDLLAVIELGGRSTPEPRWQKLLYAIKRRRTNRNPFAARTLSPYQMSEIEKAAVQEGAALTIFTDIDQRTELAAFIAQADRQQSESKGFRREMASWLHPARTSSQDGIPGYANGISDWLANAGPSVVRTFDWGDGKAAHDRQLAEGSPALIVLSTNGDSVADWLTAGQALEHAWLAATDMGLMASFLNQPVEVDDLRPSVAKVVGDGLVPQLILRVGYGRPVRATPRRPVREVMKRY